MNKMLPPVFVAALALVSGVVSAEEREKPEDETARASYSLGYQIGQDLNRQGLEIDRESVIRGIHDAQAGTDPVMSPDEMQTLLAELKRELVAERWRERTAEAEALKQAGLEFLDANKDRPGVKTTASGLQYKVLREGEGERPRPNDVVRVTYRATTIEGREFDSTDKRGEPAQFHLGGVIPGWSEGIQLMREGAKYELYIPWELAYRSRGPLAFKSLVFEVELLEVNPDSTATAETKDGEE
jgi:FKBP-type peptidyl-prolyl cis-trans isomerase FklB